MDVNSINLNIFLLKRMHICILLYYLSYQQQFVLLDVQPFCYLLRVLGKNPILQNIYEKLLKLKPID